MIESRWSQNVLIGLLAVILIALSLWGWSNGVSSAKAKRVVKDAKTISQGFQEFYKDQNRYPSIVEFENNNLMRQYITNFPPQEFKTSTCPQTFDYYNVAPQTYELRFCLPKAVMGYKTGWNTIKP